MQFTITESTGQRTLQVEWISVDTPAGEYLFQPGHAPVVVTITPQSPVLFQVINGKSQEFLVNNGILEITRNSAHLVCQVQ